MDLDQKGLATRRAVLGDAYVDSALGKATAFTAPLQELVTRHAWGNTWQRENLDLRTRSIVTVSMLVALGRMHELKVGQAASFRVNGYGEGDFAGKVRRIDAAANATTRQVEVIVSFNDAAAAPRVSGLFAEGRGETGSTQALMLTEGSVQRAGDSAFVWRVEGSQLRKVPVRLGDRDLRTGELPVLQGLAAGDRILRNPGSTLVDGQQVEWAKPVQAAPSAASAPPALAASAASAAR